MTDRHETEQKCFVVGAEPAVVVDFHGASSYAKNAG